jgi:Domain of unknown function (DUF4259)
MGTWAAGNFDSDGALDFVGDLMNQLTNTISSCFEENNADLDEGGESELMPSVAIIKILSEQCGAAPPDPSVIEAWRDQYLKIYDDQIDDLDPDAEYKSERRQNIATTFTGLIELSQQFWEK